MTVGMNPHERVALCNCYDSLCVCVCVSVYAAQGRSVSRVQAAPGLTEGLWETDDSRF